MSENNLSPEALIAWRELTESMTESQICGVEGPALEAYATAVARLRDARRRIDDEGLVVADEKGRPIPHPALAIEKTLGGEVRAWLVRYQPRIKRR